MHWIPEVSAVDDRRMEPVTGIKSIQKERWELNCCICKCDMSSILAFSSSYSYSVCLCSTPTQSVDVGNSTLQEMEYR